MAISMTGFGRGEVKSDNYQFLVECKTINHRYCDINMRLPRKINFLEDKARNFIKDFVKRGRVDLDEMWAMFKEALEIALHKLIDMREAEGKKLEEDTLKRCDILSGYIKEIEKLSDTVVEDYREKLNTRIKELLENPNEIDENRMAQEIAIYADKSSITEEIVRFNSHITQLKNTVVKDDSVGRKMDFLIQEMNREINTMGSKSSDINITNLVVEVKSELEKIREQIQNIE